MEGELLVNGEQQKGAQDMLAEAVIALQLSALRDRPAEARHGGAACTRAVPFDVRRRAQEALNATSTFVETKAVVVTRGPYAPELLKVRPSLDGAPRTLQLA